MLRISELAKLSGVSAPTIKYYVQEGLIPKPVKTGKNMAYYDEASVDRIIRIKKLQKEKFLPLEVIKRVLDSGADTDDEIEFGAAVLKANKLDLDGERVNARQIERRTGYSMDKIEILAREEVIFPEEGDDGLAFSSYDIKVIELVKTREDMGLPFDYALKGLRIYRDAIAQAVKEDMRLFAETMLGDISSRQAIRLITEADESQDAFVVLFRQKQLSTLGKKAIAQMDQVADALHRRISVPAKLGELPRALPEGAGAAEAALYKCLSRDFAGAREAIEADEYHLHGKALAIFAELLGGNDAEALSKAREYVPEPNNRALDNLAAAIAHMIGASRTPGFSTPILGIKKGMLFAGRAEALPGPEGALGLIGRYLLGVIHVSTPEILGGAPKGIALLEGVVDEINADPDLSGMPEWLAATLRYDILPVLRIRASRLAAAGLLREGEDRRAREHLGRVRDLAAPDSEESEWARMELLRMGA